MIELGAYSIYDKKALAYGTPFYQVNEQVAARTFKDLVQDRQSQVYLHPEDYDLYKVSTFNTRTGLVEPIKKEIITGKEIQERLISTEV